jgi:multifunctional 2-oxoglutarate metabolism enzyme
MELSLGVPTAPSVRSIPAKLLEENRRIINRYLAGRSGGKVSFTHIIGWAILKALQKRPAMNAAFAEVDGKPHVVRHKRVNFGLAVDIERAGTRTLVVPNIKDADDLDFSGFWSAYELLIRRVRANELDPADFAGTTVTLTNPGMIGTIMSVPRLMASQGLIVATGSIGYPAEFSAISRMDTSKFGISEVMSVTSTYDHRIIQGAESGEFLSRMAELLLGRHNFYLDLFAGLGVPYQPFAMTTDLTPFLSPAEDLPAVRRLPHRRAGLAQHRLGRAVKPARALERATDQRGERVQRLRPTWHDRWDMRIRRTGRAGHAALDLLRLSTAGDR